MTELDFYDSQASGSDLIKIFGQVVGYIMAVGAVFAALNTMYSAVSTRLVEIGTLRALGPVIESRNALKQSLRIDPKASKGAANTYLGTLYFLVPEWPIAFGDLDLAKEHLDKAIALNPDDIDANFYYGDFLYEKKEYKQAVVFYKKALSAPARSGRQVADKGRRNEAVERLEKVLAKLK